MGKTKISVTVDSDYLQRVDEIAAKRRQSRSEVISRILRNGVDQEEQTIGTLEHPLFGPAMGLLTNEKVIRGLAALAGASEEVTPELLAKAAKLGEVGKELRTTKRGSKLKEA